jgi:hypothetical protein
VTRGIGMTLRQMVERQADNPSLQAMLAAEVVVKTGRQDGPKDGCCEVCGEPAESFTLSDWVAWHCGDCAVAHYRRTSMEGTSNV